MDSGRVKHELFKHSPYKSNSKRKASDLSYCSVITGWLQSMHVINFICEMAKKKTKGLLMQVAQGRAFPENLHLGTIFHRAEKSKRAFPEKSRTAPGG